jgi:ribosomal protein L11 methyltransferase
MRWWELVVQVPPDQAQALADAIVPIAYGGVVVEPAVESEPGSEEYSLPSHLPSTVKAYLLIDPSFPEKRRTLLALAPGGAERELEDSDWAEGWRKHVTSVRTRRLLIKPPWSRAQPREGQQVIELEPGMAFGTGDHPTTLACLRAIDRLMRPGQRVLDLGTGSGILAIAAAKLGASAALGVDTDPVAVEAARENCRRNGVKVTIVEGSLDVGRDWGPDLALANLTSQLHMDLAAAIAEALPAGGVLFGAGIGEAGLEGVLRAYRDAGARGVRVGRRGAWRTIEWGKR